MEEPSITRLPTEVLHEIFSLATTVSSGELPTRDTDYAPWILGHVCERWRAATISHTMMWSTITIRKGSPPPVDLLDRQLQLSTDLPLKIVFFQSESDRCIELFEALVACSRQWRQLRLTLLRDHASPFLRVLERVRGQLPILRTLNLEGVATTTGNPFAFEVAPQLRDVTLHFQPLPIIPWQQLTRLSLTGEFTSLLPILRLAQNVTELIVLLLNDDAHLSSSTTQWIHMPLVTHCLLFQKHIVDILVLPQLEALVVEPDTAMACISFQQRSSFSLTKLGLYGDCTIATTKSLLQASPALAELTVVSLGPSDTAYLDLLIAYLLSNDVVAPQLKSIFIMANTIDQPRFVDMVDARWRISGRRLERVAGFLGETWDETSAGRLSALEDEGLKVRMEGTWS
ncbi:hypothetical protein DFH09DRAFT_1144316 [Mycena vulgaris]|nr:hypothetical protein DFH09DRAFT_1144316 [Mycena vulgaris]